MVAMMRVGVCMQVLRKRCAERLGASATVAHTSFLAEHLVHFCARSVSLLSDIAGVGSFESRPWTEGGVPGSRDEDSANDP